MPKDTPDTPTEPQVEPSAAAPESPDDVDAGPAATTTEGPVDEAAPVEPVVESTDAPDVETETPAAETTAAEAPSVAVEGADSEDDDEIEIDAYDAYAIPAGTVVTVGPSLFARVGAEVFGTFVLVLVGLGIALYNGLTGLGGGILAVGLGFGIAVFAAASAVGHISGGHFNPAVTLGAAIAGRTAWKDLLPYWLAQVVGGALAAAVIFIAIPQTLPAAIAGEDATTRTFFSGVSNGFGEHSPIATASSGQIEFGLVAALLVEIVVTAVFVGVILGVTDRRTKSTTAPLAIGLALAVLILVAIPVTNGSLNPARSLASALFSESWAIQQVWLFWVAPLAGGALAALLYRAFASEPVQDNLLEEDESFVTTEDVLVVEEHKA